MKIFAKPCYDTTYLRDLAWLLISFWTTFWKADACVFFWKKVSKSKVVGQIMYVATKEKIRQSFLQWRKPLTSPPTTGSSNQDSWKGAFQEKWIRCFLMKLSYMSKLCCIRVRITSWKDLSNTEGKQFLPQGSNSSYFHNLCQRSQWNPNEYGICLAPTSHLLSNLF